MARNLSPDYIEFVLKLNATEAQKEYHRLEKENQELQKQVTASRKAMAELEKQGKKGTDEWKNLRKSIQGYNSEMSLNRKKMEEVIKRMDISSLTLRQLNQRLKAAKKEFENTSKATNPKRYAELRDEMKRLQSAIGKADTELRGLRNSFFSLTKLKETMTGFFFQIGASILTLVTGAFRDAFNIVVDFEKANARLASVLGATKEGIKDMTDAARQLGATTSYSAAEVTSLQIELAKLGFAKEDILAMEGAVLKFATAVGTDLSRASAFTGAALRIFGKDASDAEDVLATFAVATTKTALDFSKLETSLSIVGPVAQSFGLSIEDTTALLGQLANAGFDASSAATATRNILLSLADANGDLAKALGHPEKSAEGLAAGLKKLNEEGIDLAKALELTDKRSVTAFSTFLANSDTLTDLKESISGVSYEFNAMSDTMSGTVSGAMAGLRSAAEELILKISEGVDGPLQKLINFFTSIVRGVGDVIQWFRQFGNVIKWAVGTIATFKATMVTLSLLMKGYHGVLALCTAAKRLFTTVANKAKDSLLLFKIGVQDATRSAHGLKVALSSIPWAAVISVIASVIMSFKLWRSETEKTTESQKAFKALEDKVAEGLANQKSSIESLIIVAQNENLTLEERNRAVARLNKIIPDYNAQIDATTGKYKASKKALDAYLGSLEKKIRYEASQEELKKLLAEEEKLRRQKDKADAEAQKEKDENRYKAATSTAPTPVTTGGTGGGGFVQYGSIKASHAAMDHAEKVNEAYEKAKASTKEMTEWINKGLNDGSMSLSIDIETEPSVEETLTDPVTKAGKAVDSTISKVKELKARLKELRKRDPESDEEYQEIEAEKKKIQEQLKQLKGTNSKKKGKHQTGTYQEDSIDEVTAPIEDKHQRNQLEINKQKKDLSDTEFAIKKNQGLLRYLDELDSALEKMKAGVDKTHTQTLDKITKEQTAAAIEAQKARDAISKAQVKQQEETHQNQMHTLKAANDALDREMKKKVIERKVTQEQADLFLIKESKGFHESELKELQRYYNEVEVSVNMGEEERKKRLEKLKEEIHSKQSEILTDTGVWVEKIRELSKSPTLNMMDEFRKREKEIESIYETAIALEKAMGNDTSALEKARDEKLRNLRTEKSDKLYDVKKELGQTTWQEDYQHELDGLRKLHQQGEIDEKQYQKRLLDLKISYGKKYFDYYSQLSGSMISAIQEAEIAKSDTKYDILIQQAKNNGEETAALEEEKENKKLEIQKKYADVNFAIKISQIVADTAVSIMKAFAELGPIAGAVASAMLTATGAAQVISAKAERDKIKNMSPSNVSGGKTGTAERVLSGFSEGGYTGDGGRYEVAGIVHKGEYVIPKPIMGDPRVIDAVGMIEALRRHRMPAAQHSGKGGGYADGGFTGGVTPIQSGELREAVREFRDATRSIKAYVVLRDIDRAREEDMRARAPFRRNNSGK